MQEIDEALSDEEFEGTLKTVQATEKSKRLKGIVSPKKPNFDEDSEEDDSEEVEDEDESDSEVEEEDDSEEEEDSDELETSDIKALLQKMKGKAQKAPKNEAEDDDSEEEEEEDSDDDSDNEENGDNDEIIPTLSEEKNGVAMTKKDLKKLNEKEKAAPKVKEKPIAKSKAVRKALHDASEALMKFKESRNDRTLFVKNIPNDATEEEVKDLCTEPDTVKMFYTKSKSTEHKNYAYVEFKNEDLTEKNFRNLKKAKLNGVSLVVDYVGPKSIYKPQYAIKAPSPGELDPLKLYVAGLGSETTIQEVQKLFPTAKEAIVPLRKKNVKPHGFAFALFDDPNTCRAALAEMNGHVTKGRRLTVLFGKKLTKNQLLKTQKATKRVAEKPKEVTNKKAKLDDTAKKANTDEDESDSDQESDEKEMNSDDGSMDDDDSDDDNEEMEENEKDDDDSDDEDDD